MHSRPQLKLHPASSRLVTDPGTSRYGLCNGSDTQNRPHLRCCDGCNGRIPQMLDNALSFSVYFRVFRGSPARIKVDKGGSNRIKLHKTQVPRPMVLMPPSLHHSIGMGHSAYHSQGSFRRRCAFPGYRRRLTWPVRLTSISAAPAGTSTLKLFPPGQRMDN